MEKRYLASSGMRCTEKSMELVSTVLGFDLVELWWEDEASEKRYMCPYVYASDGLTQNYPDIIWGHYPNHKKEHKLSPSLCEIARRQPNRCHWRVTSAEDDSRMQVKGNGALSALHPELHAPMKTELAYWLETEETGGVNVFIVGFALDRIGFKPNKLKFMTGIGFAIYVAAFDLDEEDDFGNADEVEAKELDTKAFLPRPLSSMSVSNLAGAVGDRESLGMGVWSQTMPDLSLSGLPLSSSSGSLQDSSPGLPVDGTWSVSAPAMSRFRTASSSSIDGALAVSLPIPGHDATEAPPPVVGASPDTRTPTPCALSMPPTWDPVDSFSYPVAEIPISSVVPDNLLMEHFTDIKHLADGSNANIFLAKFKGERVVIKMIKEEVQLDAVAVHEFDVEHGMLSRISHSNIIKLMGAGRVPRRFIVLEYLGGGSLQTLLSQNMAKPGLAQKLFRRPTFTYANLLSKAKDMAEALDFLHTRCHDGATIIHRDLKPDNVGFTASGHLKLFDFGLCTCVRRRSHPTEAYEMTGNTGSLRYMAPEVALKLPYTEKADVYSFGIMVWQMTRDRMPFKGMSREDFMRLVVHGGERPKLDKSWPVGFSNLLVSCWHRDPLQRPSFAQITVTLTSLMEEVIKPSWSSPIQRNSVTSAAPAAAATAGQPKKSERQSMWF